MDKIAKISIAVAVVAVLIGIVLIILYLMPVIGVEVDKQEFESLTKELLTVTNFPDGATAKYYVQYPSRKDGSGYTSVLTKPLTKICEYRVEAKSTNMQIKIVYGDLFPVMENEKHSKFDQYLISYVYYDAENLLTMRYKNQYNKIYSISIKYADSVNDTSQITRDATSILNDFFNL